MNLILLTSSRVEFNFFCLCSLIWFSSNFLVCIIYTCYKKLVQSTEWYYTRHLNIKKKMFFFYRKLWIRVRIDSAILAAVEFNIFTALVYASIYIQVYVLVVLSISCKNERERERGVVVPTIILEHDVMKHDCISYFCLPHMRATV